MTNESPIETALRETLHLRALDVRATDIDTSVPIDFDVVAVSTHAGDGALDRKPVARIASIAAAVALVAAVGGSLWARGGEAPPSPSSRPVAPAATVDTSTGAPVWPVLDGTPLPADVDADVLRDPRATALAYLVDVASLPADWPMGEASIRGAAATVHYVLQDVAGTVELAQDAAGFWYVTGATSGHVTVEAPAITGDGVDVGVAAGPRTPPNGLPARVAAIAADESVLGSETERVAGARTFGVRWKGAEVPAAVRVNVLDDHDGNPSTPDVVVGHAAVAVPARTPAGAPAGFSLAGAPAVFVGDGPVDAVAEAYMRARFPDYPQPGIVVAPARTRGNDATAAWKTGVPPERIAAGELFLQRRDGRWSVVAATTEGVDLSGVAVAGDLLHVAITSTNINSLVADVLKEDGSPVAGSPRPDGYAGAAYRFGTAAGPATGEMTVDMAVSQSPFVLRVQLVGGTLLSISEFGFPGP